MRALAEAANITLSSTYHYYSDKDVLLEDIFTKTNTGLGQARSNLVERDNLSDALRDRIEFQFDHMEEIVFVLKYYLHFRDQFDRNETGFVPEKTSLHIEEVLKAAQERGEVDSSINIVREAKVITHAINGYLLEIYPAQLKARERKHMIEDLHTFVMRSLRILKKEVPMI